MVIRKDGDKLYQNTKQLMIDHLKHIVRARLCKKPTSVRIEELELFLSTFYKFWEDWLLIIRMIKDITMYLDRTFLTARNLPLMYDVGLEVFRDYVIKSDIFDMKRYLIEVCLKLIELDRDGNMVDRSLLAHVISVFTSLGLSQSNNQTIYDLIFELPFLKETKSYFQQRSTEMLKTATTFEYLVKVQKKLEDEKKFADQVLNPKSLSKAIDVVKQTTLTDHMDQILKSKTGLTFMLSSNNHEQLRLLYELCSLIENGLPLVIGQVGVHVREHGLELNIYQDKVVPLEWIENFLCLQQKYNLILKNSFRNDLEFEHEINVSLQQIVNKNPKSPEYVCQYADLLLSSLEPNEPTAY